MDSIMVASRQPGRRDPSPSSSPLRSSSPREPPHNRRTTTRGQGRSKPRASLACNTCRQRKIKVSLTSTATKARQGKVYPSSADNISQCAIDPVRNTCASCRALQIPCVVSHDGDRRKAASRENIARLNDRLKYLETVVARQEPDDATRHAAPNISPTAHLSPSASIDLQAFEFDSQGSQTGEVPPIAPVLADASIIDAPAPNQQSGATFASDNIATVSGVGQGGEKTFDEFFGDPMSFALQNPHPTPPTSTTADEPDAARLEIDEESSQPRFYGPTSQRHVHAADVPLNSEVPRANHHGRTVVSMDSSPVRRQLLEKFWTAQHLSQAVVDQELFEIAQRTPQKSGYRSTFLEDTILACASRMSTSAEIRELGSGYADRAAARLLQEVQHPNIATLQGLLLLSDFEATRGRSRLGYMYSGCRMVFDFGLQENCQDLVVKGKLSATEARFRHTLFLVAYVYDHLWSLYIGRPSAIPSSYVAGVLRRISERGWRIPTTLSAWVAMSVKIGEISDILNSSELPLDRSDVGRLQQLDVELERQCAELPSAALIGEDNISELPATEYGLHVQARGIRIVLHRALTKTLAQTPNGGQDYFAFDKRRSAAVVHGNAICIARLASAYTQIYGVENLVTVMLDNIFVAAAWLMTHVLRTASNAVATITPSTRDEDVFWLSSLAETLRSAQKHYPVATRMQSTLFKLAKNTTLAHLFAKNKVVAPPEICGNLSILPPVAPMMEDTLDFGQYGQDMLLSGPFNGGGRLPSEVMDMPDLMSWIVSPLEQG